MKNTILLATCVTLIATTSTAVAHHSFAMYDTDKVVVLTGTVKEFEWTNPHALLWIIATTDGGSQDLWTVELPTSPGNLARMGWSKHSLVHGQAVDIEINPLRDGKHGGSFKKAKLASGEVLVAMAKDDPPYAGASPNGDDGGVTAAKAAGAKVGCSSSAGSAPAGTGWIWALAGTVLAFAARRRTGMGA
jgi:MYXO-CTERM domain-containing protein